MRRSYTFVLLGASGFALPWRLTELEPISTGHNHAGKSAGRLRSDQSDNLHRPALLSPGLLLRYLILLKDE